MHVGREGALAIRDARIPDKTDETRLFAPNYGHDGPPRHLGPPLTRRHVGGRHCRRRTTMTGITTTETTTSDTGRATSLRVGDLVEVRSADEILATLDERGELENLPFMPEMLAFCGRRMTVHKVAHKLCDSTGWSGMRALPRAVHLTGARCNGSAHGGCETACSLFWKEQWLRKVDPNRAGGAGGRDTEPGRSAVAACPRDQRTARTRARRRAEVLVPGDRDPAGRTGRLASERGQPVRPGRLLRQRERPLRHAVGPRGAVQPIPGAEPPPAPRAAPDQGGSALGVPGGSQR